MCMDGSKDGDQGQRGRAKDQGPKKAWCQTVKGMRQKHPRKSLGELCALLGVTRQAFYVALRYA